MINILSNINHVLLAVLTPSQRYYAIRQLQGNESLLTNKWFILFGASVVFVLIILLLVVHRYRLDREKQQSEERFYTFSDRRGFTGQERKLLIVIAGMADLKSVDSVFTMLPAFNRGAAKLMHVEFSSGRSIEERRQLAKMINCIKEKLGFKKRHYPYGVRSDSSKWLSSKQIPVGKKVSIVLSNIPQDVRIDATVIRNGDFEFVVSPQVRLESTPGQIWNVHYNFGASIWEFDALTIACDDDSLILSHSDNVRFINRRRFLRVSVNKPALIAHFPMTRNGGEEVPAAPEFIQAKVTELSGPGLRVESELDVEDGERVLLIFELEKGRVVEDIGVVRGYRNSGTGFSLGVELVGLRDFEVDELVRATNNAAMGYAVKDLLPEQEKASVFAGGHLNG